MPAIDRLLLRRFKTFLWILFSSNQSRFYDSALAFALLTFLIAVADQIAAYFIGILPSEFFVALGGRDLASFKRLIWKSFFIVSAKSLVIAANKYSTSLFYLKCREICNRRLHSLYFQNLAFYKLDGNKNIDNPDQRMTQDVEKLTRIITQDLFTSVIMAPFIISYYTYLTFDSSGWFCAAAIYLYFTISTILNKFLLSPIVRLGIEQEKKEGDFRAKHLEVRSCVEAIAFYDSGAAETLLTNEKLGSLLNVQKKLAVRRSLLSLVTNFFDYYGGTLSYLLIAIPTFLTHQFDQYSGVQLAGVVSKNAFIYLYLIYSFSRVVSLAENFGDMSAVAHRVIGLYEELQKLKRLCRRSRDTENPDGDSENFKIIIDNGCKVELKEEHVHQLDHNSQNADLKLEPAHETEALLHKPKRILGKSEQEPLTAFDLKSVDVAKINDSSLLIRELTLKIVSGQKILITGESGTGKTSLLRVIAEIWTPKSGMVNRNIARTLNYVMFLPQDSYCPNGKTTLEQQLIYPLIPVKGFCDSTVLNGLLKEVALDHLLQRFTALDVPFEGNWNGTLSRGELQRLSIARLLYHNPQFAFLDECTSAVGKDLETTLYESILKRGITFVSIGHRDNLRQFHDYELRLNSDRGWSLSEIRKA